MFFTPNNTLPQNPHIEEITQVEETENNLNYVKDLLSDLWKDVKSDDELGVKSLARFVAFGAVQIALEAVQVAAVARKIIGEGNNEYYSEME